MPITKFEKLKADFEHELTSAKNEDYLIESELQAIDQKIMATTYAGTFSANVNFGSFAAPSYADSVINHEIISTNYPFREAFKSYLTKGTFNDPSGSDEIVSQAKEVAKYYNYLRERLKEDPRKAQKQTPPLSLKQKLLVISYLKELNLSQVNNSKLAKILSQVLEMSEENIRKYLSYLPGINNEVRNRKNLETVARLFKDPDFDIISEKIQQDLDKMK